MLDGIDVAAGLATAGNNNNLYRRLLGRFRDTQSCFTDEFRTAWDGGDREAAIRCAHTLKGVAANIGAMEVRAAAEALESACVNGAATPTIDEVLARTQTTLAHVIGQLQRLDDPNDAARAARPLSDLLAQLRALMEEDDADAVELLEELTGHPELDSHAAELQRVVVGVEAFDFEEALRAMDSLESELETAQ
jgi:polar amino acid transport system substrate-binding protein